MPESAAPQDGGRSLLCAGAQERQRMLDMGDRLEAARRAAFVAMAITILAAGPWIGYTTLIPYVAAGLVFVVTERDLHRRVRPEYWIFGGWAFCQVMIASAVVLAGEAGNLFVFWLGVPTVTLPARFSNRGQVAGIALTAALIMAATIAPHPSVVLHEPFRTIAPLSALLGLAALARPLMRSDIEHRADALTDALTGLLNRAALRRDAETLTARAEAEAIPVAVLVGDLDHFKAINDQHGHDVGDVVLQEAASAIQGAMRSLDHVYRLGGEEFVVLLPGADAAEAQDIAERIRIAVQTANPAGLPVSISIGVAVGTEEIDVPTLMRSADEALYRAKRLGRNQVVVGGARTA